MIIVGYQGIGKSTLAGRDNKYIDLESSSFFVNGKRSDNWYIPYCNIAMRLSEQGFDVFISSHKVVRDYLESIAHPMSVLVVFPDISLKDEWVSRLKERFDNTLRDKDYKAWKNAESSFNEGIADISNQEGFAKFCICKMDYDLETIISSHKKTVAYLKRQYTWLN